MARPEYGRPHVDGDTVSPLQAGAGTRTESHSGSGKEARAVPSAQVIVLIHIVADKSAYRIIDPNTGESKWWADDWALFRDAFFHAQIRGVVLRVVLVVYADLLGDFNLRFLTPPGEDFPEAVGLELGQSDPTRILEDAGGWIARAERYADPRVTSATTLHYIAYEHIIHPLHTWWRQVPEATVGIWRERLPTIAAFWRYETDGRWLEAVAAVWRQYTLDHP